MSDLKVGMKVRVKSLEWYNANKNKNGTVNIGPGFIGKMPEWCGKILSIVSIDGGDRFRLDDTYGYNWCLDFIEEIVEETTEAKTVDVLTGSDIPRQHDAQQIQEIRDNMNKSSPFLKSASSPSWIEENNSIVRVNTEPEYKVRIFSEEVMRVKY